MNCPNCGFDSPREMHFCGSCGARLTVACPACDFANPLDFRFCGMCGTRLIPGGAEAPFQSHQPGIEVDVSSPILPAALIEGERRVVTVLITDLTDSTHILQKVGTEEWVGLMNRILHILETEIIRFGGEISQFRGDGLVAFFGATSVHEDDPERAVLAALSMQRAFDLYVRELPILEAKSLKMRIGIDTGEVVVTTSNDRQQWEETAMGMAVTIASRMETAAEPGTVLVSENTYLHVSASFTWRPLGEISVKGVSQPIAVYQPLAHIEDARYLPEEEALPAAFLHIGREAEFHALKKCVDGLFEGRGHIAALTGDTGSGKAFLMNEVRQYFAHLGTLLEESSTALPFPGNALKWASGRCRSYSQTWPYSMWLDLFRNWLGLRPEASKEDRRACLRLHAEALWGEAFDEHYPYLATFLGLPVEDAYSEKIRHLNADGLRQRYFLAVRSWIETASRSGPVVLAFSDLHWADDSSLALLKYCLPVCDSEALLCLLSFRLEQDTSIQKFDHFLETNYPHRLTRVDLPPLTEEQSAMLINQLISPETLPRETRDLIIRSAGGNPHYIVELIRALIANGVLVREPENGAWQITRTVTTLDLPNSLQRLLLARIDRLSSHERLALQIASVIGVVFWLDMLQELLNHPPTLKADLAALQRNQFIQESGRVPGLGMQYFFKSPLIRDATYESLLIAQQTAYHLKAAEYLENLASPDILEGYDAMLAYHYGRAGDHRKELFYTVLAAEQAQKIYANVEALQHYNRAMELLDFIQAGTGADGKIRSIQTQRFEVLNGRREVLFLLGQVESAREDTRALLPLARQMADDPMWLIDALLAQAVLTDNREDLVPGLQMAEEALALAKQAGDRHREMRSLTYVANVRFLLKDPTWRDVAEQALALARQLDDLKAEVNLLLGIGSAYGMDDLPRGREYLQAALSRSETLNDKAITLRLLQAIGQQFERDGDYHRQLVEYEQERLRLSREIGNYITEGHALMFCGQIQALYLGNYESGLELERQALKHWEGFTDRLFPLLRIAQIQTMQGWYDEAWTTLELARPLEAKVVYDIGRAGFSLVSTILHIALGDEAHLRSALEIASGIQQMAGSNLFSQQYYMSAACEASAAHLKLAQHLAGQVGDECRNHFAQALESSQSAVNLYEKFGFVQIVECTSEEILYRHSLALAANDRPAEAREYLKRAHDEMMRKYNLIPSESPYRKTYLENIALHREIQRAYEEQLLSDTSKTFTNRTHSE
jgi:class 3 adenylate cyclase/multidrug efflux pump subunit AcrA (membrane-fusion protein)